MLVVARTNRAIYITLEQVGVVVHWGQETGKNLLGVTGAHDIRTEN